MDTSAKIDLTNNKEITNFLKRYKKRGSIPIGKLQTSSIIEKPEVEDVLKNHIKNTYNYKNLTPEKLLTQLENGEIALSDIDEERRKTVWKLYQLFFAQKGQAQSTQLGFSEISLLEEIESGRISASDINIQEREVITKLYEILSKPPETYTPPRIEDVKEFWKKDRRDDDTVITFIQRVYEPWLGKGLIQADIRPIDRPLYNAFQQWKFREKSIPEGFIIPKKSDEEVSLPSKDVLIAEKEARAVKARLAYRKKKKASS